MQHPTTKRLLRGRTRKSAPARTTAPGSINGRIERPSWTTHAPNGAQLEIEFDAILQRWRISPGGYTRRELPAALAQATGYSAQTEWITDLTERLLTELRLAAPAPRSP
jgi:hypothetical protein